MGLKQQIEQDLKTAMLAGDKERATMIRGLKSAILYEEVAKGKRTEGIDDGEIIAVLSKEAKKRQESAELYTQGGNSERAELELAEKAIIEKYLPASLSDAEIEQLIVRAQGELGNLTGQNMGQIISWVKTKSAGGADGGRIAAMVKDQLGKV